IPNTSFAMSGWYLPPCRRVRRMRSAPTIDQRDRAAIEPRALDEREYASSAERREQRLAAAERDRVHYQAGPVYQGGAHEALRDRRASVGEDRLAVFALELRGLVGEGARRDARVPPARERLCARFGFRVCGCGLDRRPAAAREHDLRDLVHRRRERVGR